MADITVEELRKYKEEGKDFLLLDVREPGERRAFHIGGILEPMGNWPAAAAKYRDRKEDEVVVYCRSGRRSGLVQQQLQAEGFTNARNLTGGVLAWIDAFGDQGEDGP